MGKFGGYGQCESSATSPLCYPTTSVRSWSARSLEVVELIFTLLNALVDFAIEGFGALINLSIGLFTLAVLSYHLDIAARSGAPDALPATAPAHTAR